MFVVFGQPGEGGLADLPLFEGGDCQLRNTISEGFTALYLDKNQSFAIFCDYIDFAPLAAEVALDQLETFLHQKGRRQLFAAIADPGILQTSAISPSHAST